MHSTRLAPPSPAALTRCLATLHALAAAASLASASPFNHQRPNSSTTLSAASGPHPYPAAAHAASFSASPGPQANVTEMQTLYVTHGGGPMPVLGDPGHAHLVKHLQSVRNHVKAPKAILMVTAHWEEKVATVSTAPQPSMLYDYGGFPEESYRLQYKAPGSPELAARVRQLLSEAGLPSAEDSKRGYDHGTFVPLMLMYPEAKIPVVQMSVLRSMDPAAHLAVGAALAPLRDEGVLIVASGSSFHNMGAFMSAMRSGGGPGGNGKGRIGQDFDDWLFETLTKHEGRQRDERLKAWDKAPGARFAHPREEHLIPLMVAAGAAGSDPGHALFRGPLMDIAVSGFMFGKKADEA